MVLNNCRPGCARRTGNTNSMLLRGGFSRAPPHTYLSVYCSIEFSHSSLHSFKDFHRCQTGYSYLPFWISFRDREDNLKIFLYNIHPFLMAQKLQYQIFVIEQFGKYLKPCLKLRNEIKKKLSLIFLSNWHILKREGQCKKKHKECCFK